MLGGMPKNVFLKCFCKNNIILFHELRSCAFFSTFPPSGLTIEPYIGYRIRVLLSRSITGSKCCTGLQPVKSLQMAAGLRPVEKLSNLPAYGRLQSLQYAGECRPTADAGLWPVNSLQIAAGRRPVVKHAVCFLPMAGE
jgi:hypothetical protein